MNLYLYLGLTRYKIDYSWSMLANNEGGKLGLSVNSSV